MLNIPSSADDFTVSWMNEALAPHLGEVSVQACTATESDIPGQTAEIVLIQLQYDGSTDLPSKLIGKITSKNPLIIDQIISNYDQYRRETSFYREFPEIGIAVPRCLYEQHRPESQTMVLLLEDLTPSVSPSWALTPEQVCTAIAALPAFHGKWWNDASLRQKDWMVQYDDVAFFSAAFGAADAAAPVLEDLYGDTEVSRQINHYCRTHLDRLQQFMATRPYTFVHGDYHGKQMFFPGPEGGKFAVIDWQFPFVAQGGWDLARMAGMCLSTEYRREMESGLLDDYHQGLQTAGVNNYSRLELEIDYRLGLIVSQMIMSIAAADTDYRLLEAECDALGLDWRDVMFDRTHKALIEWDVLDFLKSI